ncbi:MAG: hypothetical protein RLZZ127_691 [Planctomycetota bacterium]|jgi:serine phosphatase RsbU (regulator of sigma subunit)
MSDPAPGLTLEQVADLLVGVESVDSLLTAIDDLLAQLLALPARLYLWDGGGKVYYAAHGFGCPREAPDLRLPDPLPRGWYRLSSRGAPVGLLVVESEWSHDPKALEHLGALLGPILIALHRQERSRTELREAQVQVEQVINAGDLLSHLDVEILLVKIVETMLSATHAQVAALLTPDAAGVMQVRVPWGFPEDVVRRVRFLDGTPVVDRVAAGDGAVCLEGAQVGQRLDLDAIAPIRITALLALPLSARGRTQGVLVLANPEDGFDEHRQRLARTLCAMAAIALDNALLVKATLDRDRLQQEMDLARSVQTGMYPVGGLELPGLAAEGASRPCDETGGDYYTYLERDGHLLAMIGDVSGHGIGAALFTTMAHAVITQQLRAGVQLEPAFMALNDALSHGQSGRFMTAALVELDPVTRVFRYVSAGHNPLLWIHQGEPRWLESCGMPMGIMAGAAYPPPAPLVGAPGDLLILYTDGFTEAADPANELYGDDRLAAAAARAAAGGPGDVLKTMVADVDRFADGRPLADDLTMVVIRFR